MKNYKIGYTQGVFDMFHVGHLNLLNEAKKQCEILIVGINSDNLVKRYKNKTPVINEMDRKKIIENIKSVNKAIIVETLDKVELFNDIKFNAVFIGDDWKGDERWEKTKRDLKKLDVDVMFIPYTKNISSTFLKKEVINVIDE